MYIMIISQTGYTQNSRNFGKICVGWVPSTNPNDTLGYKHKTGEGYIFELISSIFVYFQIISHKRF